jgi:hypothetical protein
MVGFHKNLNILKCARPVSGVSLEIVDSSTNDGYPMHVCPEKSANGSSYSNPYRYAMSGIHVNNNKLTCAR